MTNIKTKTKPQGEEFVIMYKDLNTPCVNVYRLQCPLGHDIHCPFADKDIHKMFKRPNSYVSLLLSKLVTQF